MQIDIFIFGWIKIQFMIKAESTKNRWLSEARSIFAGTSFLIWTQTQKSLQVLCMFLQLIWWYITQLLGSTYKTYYYYMEKNYMHKILIDRFCEFQKSTQKWKFLTFLAIFTYYKAFNGIIFIFLKYSRLLWARWCIFQKNPRQNFFDQNHCISPRYNESYDLTSGNKRLTILLYYRTL